MSIREDINGQADSQEDIMLCSADVCAYVCVFVCVHNPHFLIFLFLHILHTYMFHIIKQILILNKDKPSKYNCSFNDDFIY